MKNRISSLCLAMLLAVPMVATLGGCAMGNTSIAKEDSASLQQKLLVGKTTKDEVLHQFGEPAERAITNGREVWTYSMVDTQFRTYVPFAGMAAGNNGTDSTNLVITFDKAGKVASHDLVKFKG